METSAFLYLEFQGAIGKAFKKDAKVVTEAIAKIDSREITEKEKELDTSGKVKRCISGLPKFYLEK